MNPMMEVAIVFSALNSALLIVLLILFARIAVKSRASHSVGLMFFALLLLANSALTAYSYATMAPFFGRGALPYLSTMSVLEFVGLSVLLKITL
jgi:cadmium resistance protein CadD (predicted permease)